MDRRCFRVTRPLFLCCAALFLAASPVGAGTTGKLTGKVTNKKKMPVGGVNVRIEGLRIGALSDENGDFFMIGVPGGNYTVRANRMGMRAFVAENVSITPDFTTELNIPMSKIGRASCRERV